MTTRCIISRAGRGTFRLLAVALVVASPAAVAGTPINERAAADPAGQVEISNISGSVVVTGWDRNEIEVTGELGEGSEKLEFSRTNQLTRIKVILPKRSSHVESSDLIVKVPARSSIGANTVSADLRIQGVHGAQRLQSVSGNIHTGVDREDVECKTVSGNIHVTGSGQANLTTVMTVSGDATLDRLAGEVNGNTVSGDLNVSMGETIAVAFHEW
jgi:DUF4097 and DUF4098 domain-containing protein YvlB